MGARAIARLLVFLVDVKMINHKIYEYINGVKGFLYREKGTWRRYISLRYLPDKSTWQFHSTSI